MQSVGSAGQTECCVNLSHSAKANWLPRECWDRAQRVSPAAGRGVSAWDTYPFPGQCLSTDVSKLSTFSATYRYMLPPHQNMASFPERVCWPNCSTVLSNVSDFPPFWLHAGVVLPNVLIIGWLKLQGKFYMLLVGQNIYQEKTFQSFLPSHLEIGNISSGGPICLGPWETMISKRPSPSLGWTYGMCEIYTIILQAREGWKLLQRHTLMLTGVGAMLWQMWAE